MAIYAMFMQHILYSLKEDGKAAIVIPTGFLTTQSNIEKTIRKKMVEEKMLAGVISMPSNIFANTGTNVSIIIIDKAHNSDKVLLMDASKLGTKVKVGKNQTTVLSHDEEELIINTFTSKDQVEDLSVVITYDEMVEKNCSFSADQYFEVKVELSEMTQEEFNSKIQDITTNLNTYFEQSKTLETEIKNQLGGLQYE